ncbi:hypothetical protein [Viscerimonas tarda]
MKKKLFFWTNISLLFLGVLMFSASCSDDNDSRIIPDESAYWDKRTIVVTPQQWLWDSEQECYFYSERVPWLDSFIASDGIVIALINNSGTYKPLPFTANYYEPANPGGYFYSETIDYEYGASYIRFNVKESLLFSDTDQYYVPGTYEFQLRLIW